MGKGTVVRQRLPFDGGNVASAGYESRGSTPDGIKNQNMYWYFYGMPLLT